MMQGAPSSHAGTLDQKYKDAKEVYSLSAVEEKLSSLEGINFSKKLAEFSKLHVRDGRSLWGLASAYPFLDAQLPSSPIGSHWTTDFPDCYDLLIRDEKFSDSPRPRGLLGAHTEEVMGLAPFPNGVVASITHTGDVGLWNLRAGGHPTLYPLQSRGYRSHCALTALNDNLLVLGGIHGRVEFYDINNPANPLNGTGFSNDHGPVTALLPLEKDFFAAAKGRTIQLLEVVWGETDKGRVITELTTHQILRVSSPVKTMVKVNDVLLASGSSDGQVYFWNLESGGFVASFKPHATGVNKLLVVKQKHKTFLLSGSDYSLRQWDISNLVRRWEDNVNAEPLAPFKPTLVKGHDIRAPILDMVLLGDGRLLVSVKSDSANLCLWDSDFRGFATLTTARKFPILLAMRDYDFLGVLDSAQLGYFSLDTARPVAQPYKRLLHIIQHSTALRSLNCSGRGWVTQEGETDALEELMEHLPPNLTSLMLARSGLGKRGGEVVAERLVHHHSLLHLDVRFNHLGGSGRVLSSGAEYLAKALKKSHTLCALALTCAELNSHDMAAFNELDRGRWEGDTYVVREMPEDAAPLVVPSRVSLMQLLLPEVYSAQHIHRVIQAHIQRLGGFRPGSTYLLKGDETDGCFADISHRYLVAVTPPVTDTILTHYLAKQPGTSQADVFDEIMPCLKEPRDSYVKILFPYQPEPDQWITGEIIIGSKNEKGVRAYRVIAYAHDPRGPNKALHKALIRILNTVTEQIQSWHKRWKLPNKGNRFPRFDFYETVRQTADEKAASGIIVADELPKRIQGVRLDQVIPVATLRDQQQQLVASLTLPHTSAYPLPSSPKALAKHKRHLFEIVFRQVFAKVWVAAAAVSSGHITRSSTTASDHLSDFVKSLGLGIPALGHAVHTLFHGSETLHGLTNLALAVEIGEFGEAVAGHSLQHKIQHKLNRAYNYMVGQETFTKDEELGILCRSFIDFKDVNERIEALAKAIIHRHREQIERLTVKGVRHLAAFLINRLWEFLLTPMSREAEIQVKYQVQSFVNDALACLRFTPALQKTKPLPMEGGGTVDADDLLSKCGLRCVDADNKPVDFHFHWLSRTAEVKEEPARYGYCYANAEEVDFFERRLTHFRVQMAAKGLTTTSALELKQPAFNRARAGHNATHPDYVQAHVAPKALSDNAHAQLPLRAVVYTWKSDRQRNKSLKKVMQTLSKSHVLLEEKVENLQSDNAKQSTVIDTQFKLLTLVLTAETDEDRAKYKEQLKALQQAKEQAAADGKATAVAKSPPHPSKAHLAAKFGALPPPPNRGSDSDSDDDEAASSVATPKRWL